MNLDHARRVAGWLGALAAAAFVPAVHAQCTGEWVPIPGMSGVDPATTNVSALTLWDPDGAGPLPPLLVAAGTFTMAGSTPALNIATWDGVAWSTLGSGIVGAYLDALAVLPDGRLVVSGSFTSAGGVPVNNIAVWNGTAWSSLGTGMDNEVFALAVSHAGDLYAGGLFTTAGGVTCNRIARWDAAVGGWSSVGTGTHNGVNNAVYAIGVLPNNDVVVGGSFTTAGGALSRYVARWNGTAWSPLGASISSAVLTLVVMPNSDVVVGGLFAAAGRIARWNGSSWSTLGAGLDIQPLCLQALEDGSVIAGGWFHFAGGVPVNNVARWDGAAWSGFGSGVNLPAGVGSYVIAQAVMPNGDLIVGGNFTIAGGNPAAYLARWSVPHGPTVSQQPASVTTCPSGTPAFIVVATGSTPMFQWQAQLDPGVWTDLVDGALVRNGVTLCTVSGAGLGTLQLSGLDHFAAYGPSVELRCVVTDACSSATSGAATLRVCPADFDCSGGLAVQDIFGFLNAWFAASPGADFNGINGLTVQDIFDFLAAWFAGC
jgi:hypothetical protein